MDKKYKKYKQPNIFERNFSFAGKMDFIEFWQEVGMRVITLLCCSILLCIFIVVMVPGDTEYLIGVVNIAVPILAAIWAVSVVALSRRRLRDAGYSAKSYLWLLLPVIGWIIFIVCLCKKSK